MPIEFFELVRQRLPADIDPGELIALAPEEWWRTKNRVASAYALRKSPLLDWDAYLDKNPDVKASGMDACLHFLRYGVHEGRHLFSKPVGREKMPQPVATSPEPVEKLPQPFEKMLQPSKEPGAPLVTIIINNYNNAHYLDQSIRSAQAQTLKDMEILLVDDGSTDQSIQVMEKYARSDPRVKIVALAKNQGTYAARRIGANAARGQYSLFLDPDDCLVPEACERLYGEISKGYDMVIFSMLYYDSLNKCEVKCPEPGYQEFYEANDIEVTPARMQRMLFEEMSDRMYLCSRIYDSSLLKRAFNEFPDCRVTLLEDMLASLALVQFAKKIYKINDQLYVYNFKTGICSRAHDDERTRKWFSVCDSIRLAENYIRDKQVNINFSRYKQHFCLVVLRKLLNTRKDPNIKNYYRAMIDTFGLENVIATFWDNFKYSLELLADILYISIDHNKKKKNISHIALHFESINLGGTETVLTQLAESLSKAGYQVTIFVENFTANDHAFSSAINIIRIPRPGNSGETLSHYVNTYMSMLKTYNVDMILSFMAFRPALAWDIMIANELGIPILASMHVDINWYIYMESAGFSHHTYTSLLRCLEGVTCLAVHAEQFYRTMGVNALYMPNPIPQAPARIPDETPKKNLIFVGRLGDPVKRPHHLIYILREVIKTYPETKLYLVGGFGSDQQRKEFEDKIRALKLNDNVILTGWIKNPDVFYRQGSIFISASYWEGFPMAMSEALSHGLPCVIYDMPIEHTRGNEAVITVPQGEYEKAAREVIKLFDEPERWRRLSEIAHESMKQYTPDIYGKRMLAYLGTFDKFSVLRDFSPADYKIMMDAISWYAQHPRPKWGE